MTQELTIKNVDQVKRISQLASKEDYRIMVSCGSVLLDARSIMGLFALIGKKANIVASDHADAWEFGRLVDKMR